MAEPRKRADDFKAGRLTKQDNYVDNYHFPYNIIYRHLKQEIRVIAVAHQHRKPGYWKQVNQHNNKIKEFKAVYVRNYNMHNTDIYGRST